MKISVTSVTSAATGTVVLLYRLRWSANSAIDFVLPDLGKDYGMLPGWAVVVTQPQTEAKVVARVGKLGYRVFYPKIVRRLRHKGKRISIMCPLFPGYLFTWIEMKWAGLLNVNGVAGLLMNDGELATVGDLVMNELKSRCDRNGIYFNPIRKFSKGQKVRIEYGFFAGMLGTVERFSKREDEVILLMDVLGAKRPVKVNEGTLTKV